MTQLTIPNRQNPTKVSYLLPQNFTCVAKTRITAATKSQITSAELLHLRQLVVLTIGG